MSAPDTDEPRLIAMLRADLDAYFKYHQPGRRAQRRDLWRNFLHPRCLPVALFRLSRACERSGLRPLAQIVGWFNFFLNGLEISARCVIGPGFFMPHANGTVIGADRIGANAVIYHQVTIGAKSVDPAHSARPVVGDDAFIASGAKVIGAIVLGDRCRVGANAVVTKSCGPDMVLTGIPAVAHPALRDASGAFESSAP